MKLRVRRGNGGLLLGDWRRCGARQVLVVKGTIKNNDGNKFRSSLLRTG